MPFVLHLISSGSENEGASRLYRTGPDQPGLNSSSSNSRCYAEPNAEPQKNAGYPSRQTRQQVGKPVICAAPSSLLFRFAICSPFLSLLPLALPLLSISTLQLLAKPPVC